MALGSIISQIDVRCRRQLGGFILVCYTFFLPIIDGKSGCQESWLKPRIYTGAPGDTRVMMVRAINAFNSADVIYRLLNGSDKFHLDEKSGRLKTVDGIDRNVGDEYHLLVNVSSGGVSKICNIDVEVTIQNRHTPRFTKRNYLETINYNHQPGSEILTVETTDISTEPYNKETYYFLREEAKEDDGHMSKKVSGIDKVVVDKWMYSELDSDGQGNQSLNEYLAIDRSTGVVYLKRQLDDNVGRITAKVLVVDGGSPPLSTTVNVEVTVKVIGRPSNVRVENITATGATACWLPSPIGQAKGFKIQFQDLTDGDKNQSLEVVSSPVQPLCANLSGLQLATSYELWVFGYDDQMAGLNSSRVLFTTLSFPSCSAELVDNNTGIFSFEKTEIDRWVELPCPYGPLDVKATRQCTAENDDKNPTWGNFNDSACNQLEQFESLFNSSLRDAEDANESFTIVSNLMEANVTDAKTSNRIINMIENFVSSSKFDKSMNITTKNLFVEVLKVSNDKNIGGGMKWSDVHFTGLSPKQSSKQQAQPLLNGSPVDDPPTLTLSAIAFSNFYRDKNITDIQVNFVAYRSAALFRETLVNDSFVDRPVLTVSLTDFNVKNLNNVVSYKVKKPQNGTWSCVYWNVEESRWSQDGMTEDHDGHTITCSSSHMTSFSILFDPNPKVDPGEALSIISYVGSGLSVLGLILTILTFALFRCLNREHSGKILLNLCMSMLLLNVSFLSGAFQSETLKKSGQVIQHPSGNGQAYDTAAVSPAQRDPVCTAVAVFTHYFLLTTLSWMTVEAINMYQLLIYVFASTESRFLLKRCSVAWGVPAIIVGVTVAVNSAYYTPSNQYCMLSAVDPYVYYFALFGPCCILLLVNVTVFVMVTRVLCQPRSASGRIPSKYSPNGKAKEESVTWSQVRGAFAVMTLLGVTWVFGAFAVSGPVREVFQYVFCVLNSLQGLLLFVFRCLLYPEARSAWLMLFRTGTLKKHRGPAKSSTTNTTSNCNSHTKLALRIVSSNASYSTANIGLSSDRRHSNSTKTKQSTSSFKSTDGQVEGGDRQRVVDNYVNINIRGIDRDRAEGSTRPCLSTAM